jgi:hypothetical protein
MKINEYSFFENRDIWEYKLNFSGAEIKKLLSLIWDYNHGERKKYYFFKRNCAYELTRILYQAKNIPFENSFNLYYSPLRTIKDLNRKNLISGYSFRPALLRKMKRKYEKLSPKELDEFWGLQNKKLKANLSFSAIDLALDKIRYDSIKEKSPADKAKVRSLLLAKSEHTDSKIDLDFEKLDPSTKYEPVFIGLGQNFKSSRSVLMFRPGVHDYSDLHYEKDLKYAFNIAETEISIKENIRLEKFTLFHLGSLGPIHLLESPLSWDSKLTIERDQFSGNYFSQFSTSLGFFWKGIFVGLNQKSTWQEQEKKNISFAPGLHVGFLHQIAEFATTNIQLFSNYDLGKKKVSSEASLALRFFISDKFALETRAKLKKTQQQNSFTEQSLLVLHYF